MLFTFAFGLPCFQGTYFCVFINVLSHPRRHTPTPVCASARSPRKMHVIHLFSGWWKNSVLWEQLIVNKEQAQPTHSAKQAFIVTWRGGTHCLNFFILPIMVLLGAGLTQLARGSSLSRAISPWTSSLYPRNDGAGEIKWQNCSHWNYPDNELSKLWLLRHLLHMRHKHSLSLWTHAKWERRPDAKVQKPSFIVDQA